ncbi:hypothetical protein EE612_055356, partial [Oryza sativa]
AWEASRSGVLSRSRTSASLNVAFKGEGWILGGACRCYRLHHGCSWQWDFDVDRESSAPAMVFGELGCTRFISICSNLFQICSSSIGLILS